MVAALFHYAPPPFEYLRDHLGYRMELRQARYDRSALGQGRLPVEVDVVNRGFAPAKHPRPVRIVLLDGLGRTVASADTGADWRDWQPQGRSETNDDHTAPKASTVRATLTLHA
ncbi:DUF4832 domain-containing protein [Streptomyces sp. NPDC001933]|uniref:DUF4832 domain-containing protein n=1 Tax=Streptomyces sp. NPDC001933 TaxID=3364626 RepID=UPI0036A8FA33